MGTRLRKSSQNLPNVAGNDDSDLNLGEEYENSSQILAKYPPQMIRGKHQSQNPARIRSQSSNPYSRTFKNTTSHSRNHSKGHKTVLDQPGEARGQFVNVVNKSSINQVGMFPHDQSYGLNAASISNLHDRTNQEYLLGVQMSYRNNSRNKISTYMKKNPIKSKISIGSNQNLGTDEYTMGPNIFNSKKISLPQKTPSKRSMDTMSKI